MTSHSPREIQGEPPLLRVENMVKRFRVPGGVIDAVSGVGFSLGRGETLGLVGESGCGKSTTGRAVLQLPPPDAGSVRFRDAELTALSRREMRRIRPRLQIVWQDPRSALNPGRRVRDLVAEGLVIAGRSRAGIADRVDAALAEVGLNPSEVGDRRPHEFSGGQCQRIAIARALVLEPELLVCDEPVASLDVSVQAQVINLLQDVKAGHGLSLLFISHDLGVVRNVSDRVAVMYLGRIVEIGDVGSVYGRPAHPYTRALLDAVPVPDPLAPPPGPPLTGEVPSPLRPPSGCRFRTRCPLAQPVCAERTPELRQIGDDHQVACHFSPDESADLARGSSARSLPERPVESTPVEEPSAESHDGSSQETPAGTSTGSPRPEPAETRQGTPTGSLREGSAEPREGTPPALPDKNPPGLRDEDSTSSPRHEPAGPRDGARARAAGGEGRP